MKTIGGISFTKEGYENFVSLSKEEQIEKVYNSLNPKDRVQAESLLTRVPNGNSSGTKAEAGEYTTKRPTGSGKARNNAEPGADKSEG